jgi:hypothetical protein
MYWITQSVIENSYVLLDACGIVLFAKFIRMRNRELEINIQFDTRRREVSEMRVAKGMLKAFAWLKKAMPMTDIDSVYFKSKNTQLVKFAEQGLGFVQDGNVWRYSVPRGGSNGETHQLETGEAAEV